MAARSLSMASRASTSVLSMSARTLTTREPRALSAALVGSTLSSSARAGWSVSGQRSVGSLGGHTAVVVSAARSLMAGGAGFRSHVRHYTEDRSRDGPGGARDGPGGARDGPGGGAGAGGSGGFPGGSGAGGYQGSSGAGGFQGGMQNIPRPGGYQGGQGGRQGYQGSQYNDNFQGGGRAVGRDGFRGGGGGGGINRGMGPGYFSKDGFQKDPRKPDRVPRGLVVTVKEGSSIDLAYKKMNRLVMAENLSQKVKKRQTHMGPSETRRRAREAGLWTAHKKRMRWQGKQVDLQLQNLKMRLPEDPPPREPKVDEDEYERDNIYD